MATAATLDAVVNKLEELNKSVETGFKSIGPPIEASEQTTSEGLGEIETYTSETANSMTGPAIDAWTGMENHLDSLGKSSSTADISRSLTLQHLGEISDSSSMAELAQRDQTVSLMNSIDSWALSNDMALGNLDQSFRDGSQESIDSITGSLTEMMKSQDMHQGQIWDELKDMNIELADSFARQFNFDVNKWREEKEMLSEAARGKMDKAEGKEAKDVSWDFGFAGILAGLAAFLIGFVQGYIAELKLIGSGLVKGIKALGKDAKAIWNFGKAWLKETKFVKWLGSVKNWFNTKIGAVLLNLKTAWQESTIGKLVKSVKGWFKTKIGWKLIDLKAAWAESTIAKLVTRIKTWFSTPIGAKLGSIKAMFAESAIGRFIKSVKGLAGKSAFLDELGKGVVRVKSMFTAGGPGMFSALGTWFKSFKIPFPKWITDIIAKAKGLVKGGGFFGSLGSVLGKLFVWFQIITAVFDFWGGWTDTQGSLWDKLWGGLSAALKGFINAFLDLGIMIEDGIKWIIKKIAGFFGFDEDKVAAAMGEFSIFKPLKEGFNAIVDWVVKLATNPLAAFEDLFGGVATVGLWIYNNALKPLWDWFEGMFPDLAADIKPFFAGIASVGLWIYDNALKPFWDWFTGIFDDPMATLAAAWGAIASFGTWIYDNAIKPVWDWIAGVFGFGDEDKKEDSRSFFQILGDTVSGIWTWFKGLFGWGDEKKPAEQEEGGVLSFLTGMVTGVWNWFKGLFDFSSFGAGLASAARLIFLPWTALLDLIGGVWTWFKGIFGFEEPQPEDPRTLSQKLGGLIGDVWTWFTGIFGFGDDDKPKEGKSFITILGEALSGVWTWIKSIFDIDLKSVAKSIMPGWMYSWFYDDAEVPTEGAKVKPPSKTAAKPPTASLTEADVTKIMESIDFRMFDFGSIFSYDLNFGESLKQTLSDAMMGGIPGLAVQKAAKGALVGMKMPAGGALGLEDGGLFTLSQGEMVLDNQAAQTFLTAAQMLTGVTGQDLTNLQRQQNELGGGAGGAPTIITDASTIVSNQSQPLVIPTLDIAPNNPENSRLSSG